MSPAPVNFGLSHTLAQQGPGSITSPLSSAEKSEILSEFNSIGIRARTAVIARDYSTFAIGGELQFLIEPGSIQDLKKAVGLISSLRLSLPIRLLGAGSNLLIDDRGVAGITIRLTEALREVKFLFDGTLEVGAAASVMKLSRQCAERGLAGLEFAGGIPATIGGAVKMNAGAHGRCFADVIKSVTVVTPAGEIEQIAVGNILFSYRNSGLPADAIIVGATLALRPSTKELVGEQRQKCLDERKRRQPLSLPSAGSIFKNPDHNLSAGAMIEQCGLKGRIEGGAMISGLHANWIVNSSKSASYLDVCRLITESQRLVKEKFNVNLVAEVIRWIDGQNNEMVTNDP